MAVVSSGADEARRMFEKLINEHYAGKTGRVKPWTKYHVARVIKCIHGANLAAEIGHRRTVAENYFSRCYDVLTVEGVERVIEKKTREDGSVRIMLPREEYYDTMQKYHEKMGHIGFERLCTAVRQRFAVPRHIVSMFITCCNICNDFRMGASRGRPPKRRKTTARKILSKTNPVMTTIDGIQASSPARNAATDLSCMGDDSIVSMGDSEQMNNTASMQNLLEVPQVSPAAQKQTPPQPPPAQPQKLVLPQVSAPKPIAPKPTSTPISPLQPLPPPPEVCLRWNSYHSNMQATFPSLLNNEQFVDVTLACEGRSIKCHKMMLSACSAYFEELLSQNPCQHPIVLMKDLKYWEVQALVDFMYRGEVNVAQDKLPSLLAAAEALQIKGLAGPAFSSHDEENVQSSAPITSVEDYLDEAIPSPTGGAKRARKRRVMSSAPSPRPQTVQSPQIPVTPTRSTAGKRAVKPALSMPSTSNYQHESSSHSSEPLARRVRKSDSGELEIKIEPIDIEISNDSMDQIEDGFMEKTFDFGDAGDGGESSGQGDDPGGTVEAKKTASSDAKRNIRGRDSESMDFGSNNGNDQNFTYDDSASQDGVSSVPDLPGTSYQDPLSQPSSSGMNSAGSKMTDNLLGHM